MPAPVQYIPRPFVGDRYEPSGRLGDYMRLRGQQQADAIRRGGEVSAAMWSNLGQQVGGTLRELAMMPALARQRQAAEAAALAEQQRKDDELALRRAELEARTADRNAERTEKQQLQARVEANELGEDLSPGAITQGQMDVLQGSPRQAARTRYVFGPGTAEGPELAPTDKQAELANWRTAIEAQGGKVGPNGQVFTPPKPEPVNLQRETVIVNGRPTIVNFNPRTGTYTDLKGQPVSDARPILPQGPAGGEPLEPVIDPKSGEAILLPRSQARGMRPATTREQPTEDERKSAGFYRQMQESIAILDELESKLTDKDLYQMQSLPQEELIGAMNRGEMSEAAKRYLRAFEQFTEARMRPVSGAAISDTEFARDRRTYAKQYGETPALAADRKKARESALESLKARASRALPRDNGNGGTVIMVAPDGTEKAVPSNQVEHYKGLGAKVKR